MILLEVENRGVEDALKDHFANATSKGKFEIVDAKIVDFDGCMYELVSNSARDTLKVIAQTHNFIMSYTLLDPIFHMFLAFLAYWFLQRVG